MMAEVSGSDIVLMPFYTEISVADNISDFVERQTHPHHIPLGMLRAGLGSPSPLQRYNDTLSYGKNESVIL